MIEMYTDLTFSEDTTKDYNMLAEKKYDAMILSAIPVNDAEEFSNIVAMMCDDEYENVNSIQGRVKNLIFGVDNILQSTIANIVLNQINGGNKDVGQFGYNENQESADISIS